MKRYVGLILLIAALGATTMSSSQATRQSPGRVVTTQAANGPAAESAKQIDEAGVELNRLNQSQGRMMDSIRRMNGVHNGMNDKISAVCNVKDRITYPDARKAVEELCDTAARSNKEMLALQTQMQNESRQFQTISNVMKTKHDTAKNAISNIR